MKFSAQEEYGLRCLLRIARTQKQEGLTIPEIAMLESLTQANAAKLLRILRMNGFVGSSRGQQGGYKLAKNPAEIFLADVLEALGGRLFEAGFCADYTGASNICTHTIDCSIRSLWRAVQGAVDSVLKKVTLADLLRDEGQVENQVTRLLEEPEFGK